MRTYKPITALLIFGAMLSGCAEASDSPPAWTEPAAAAAAGLGQALMLELQAAMAEGGPVQGIEICRARAPEIADEQSTPAVRVERTALRVRNPDNEPDAWEREALKAFERRMAAGENAASLQAWTETEVDGRPVGRWMKAIPTQPLCVTCHGESLAPDLASAIEEAYPDDRATGFKVGELRGAFTVDVILDHD